MVHIIRCFKIRKLCVAEFKFKITPVRNKLCIINCLRNIGKEFSHFLLALKVKLIGMKFQPCIITYNVVSGYTYENLLNFSILLFNIMNIICSSKRYACFSCNTLNSLVNRLLLRQAMILQFKIIISVSEKLVIPKCCTFRPFIVLLQKCLRYFTRKTGRKAY